MFYFKSRGVSYCVDATEETGPVFNPEIFSRVKLDANLSSFHIKNANK